MFDVLDMGASGLLAQRTRLDTIAAEHRQREHDAQRAGQPIPYRRRFATLAEGRDRDAGAPGVRVDEIRADPPLSRSATSPAARTPTRRGTSLPQHRRGDRVR